MVREVTFVLLKNIPNLEEIRENYPEAMDSGHIKDFTTLTS